MQPWGIAVAVLAMGAISPGSGVVRANDALTVDLAEATAVYEGIIAKQRSLVEAARRGDHAAFDRVGVQRLVGADAAAVDRLAPIINTAPTGPADCLRAASLYDMTVGFISSLWLYRRSPEIAVDNAPAQRAFANPVDFVGQFDEGLDRHMPACERALGRPSGGPHALGRRLVESLPQ